MRHNESGAVGYIERAVSTERLVAAVEDAAAGIHVAPSAFASLLLERWRPRSVDSLTPRQRQCSSWRGGGRFMPGSAKSRECCAIVPGMPVRVFCTTADGSRSELTLLVPERGDDYDRLAWLLDEGANALAESERTCCSLPSRVPPARSRAVVARRVVCRSATGLVRFGGAVIELAADFRTVRTTTLKRRLKAPRERVYAALIDPEAIQRWRVPIGMTCEVHAFEGSQGGSVRISLSYDSPGQSGKTTARTDTYHGRFLELVPNERVVEIDEFESTDPALQGEMKITITLTDSDDGTELLAVHEDIPRGVSLADNELGWQSALSRLAALVEA